MVTPPNNADREPTTAPGKAAAPPPYKPNDLALRDQMPVKAPGYLPASCLKKEWPKPTEQLAPLLFLQERGFGVLCDDLELGFLVLRLVLLRLLLDKREVD